ncbi:tail fiber protein [Xenorhabdus sp. PB62.4]|uniref:tail fiber protein n=1 Tax=Xenorhabdus sp. PB62.4 TaxID=1851573 RepID=UPI0021028B5B|nr:tail fiber protein [Xenorhabdus sp. PB62.4]MBC8954026.1 tail protein [Xenorhabdus sp. PB62.4]
MKEVRYSAKIQEQQISSNAKGIGPETDKLKDKFKEGSIPLQTDFNQLIDIADVGRKACGQAPQQSGPGEGLKLDDSGTLSLKMGTLSNQNFSPLILEEHVLSVSLGSGLINQTDAISGSKGVAVKASNGISVSNTGVAVKPDNGISVSNTGVAVKAYNGISIASTGVAVKAYNGISVASTGVAVKAYNGINVSNNGVAVKPYNGISVDSNGVAVKVKTDGGIKVDANGVAIDPNKILPKGMIVMFSGSSAPEGWAFCDGGTHSGVRVPDLRNRFILGANTLSEQVNSSGAISGSGSNRTYNVTTTASTVSVNVNVNSTSLTIDQIPAHQHIGGMRFRSTSGMEFSYSTRVSGYSINNSSLTESDSWPYGPYTSYVGGSNGHTHTATATSSTHSHSVNVLPPYYTLAFIIKL